MTHASSTVQSVIDETHDREIRRARQSQHRATRIREFIQSHLPPGTFVDVVLTPHIETAAVLPASVDALVDSDTTDVDRERATRLLEGIDPAAEYLVLITTNPASLDRIPINDQLTADHAHQFGLAFHELLHILKTSITTIGQLIADEVDTEYHRPVHDLINIVEDGAIEREAIEGTNFSDNAEIRLELTRRLHSQTPDDLPEGEQVQYSFWDAVMSALYEWAIYPTDVTDVLLDYTDDRLVFASQADASAFESVRDPLRRLAREALAIQGVSLDGASRSHDKTASVRRAQLVIETWNTAILPIVQDATPDRDSSSEEVQAPNIPDSPTETRSPSSSEAHSTSDPGGTLDDEGRERAGGPSLEREATESRTQDVLEQPSITPDFDADDAGSSLTTEPSNNDPTDSFTSEAAKQPQIDHGQEATTASAQRPESRANALARTINRSRERSTQSSDGEVRAQEDRDCRGESTQQSTIGAFDSDSPEKNALDEERPSGVSNLQGEPTEVAESETPAGDGSTSTRDRSTPIQSPGTPPENPCPAHTSANERDATAERERYETALSPDRTAAHDEATQGGLDTEALHRELDDLAARLDREDSSHGSGTGGSGGGPGSLDDLTILPVSDDVAPGGAWGAIEDGATHVAGTLEKQLRLDRQRGVRRGLTAGSYDTTAGHRLVIGDPRVCKVTTPGREKRYALVLVLDRSGSMRSGDPPKIEVATQALARFAVAAEALGINVAIVDFLHGQARLVKPFSVPTRHVQATLLDTDCGGGTPLADALGLARRLVEDHRDEPLIVTVTDDEPSSVDDVVDQISASYAPICSLTIATDTPSGTLSPDASKLASYYERQLPVYDAEQLDTRLDQFASLLVGF